MAVSFTITTSIQVTDSDLASTSTDPIVKITKTVPSVSDYRLMRFVVAADATSILWDPNNDAAPVGSFQHLVMWADGVLDVELTTGEGEATEELSSFRLAANTPYMLGADDSYRNHSASDVYAGTLDVLDKIRVDEPNSTTVTCWLLLIE